LVSKSYIVDNIPALSNLNTVADGDTVSANIENINNQTLMNKVILLYQFVRDDAVGLEDDQTFDGLITFDGGIKVGDIGPLTTNGNIILSLGTGAIYIGSATAANQLLKKADIQTLINSASGAVVMIGATSGVDGVAGLVPIPVAGKNLSYLRGDATWVDPFSWTQKTSNFTTAASGKYKCTSGVTGITLHAPASGAEEFVIKPEIGNSFQTNPITLTGAMNVGGVAAASFPLNQNVVYRFTTNGTDYDVSAEQLAR